MFREFFLQSRGRHKFGGIHFQHSLTHQELKKGTQGGELAGNGSFLLLRRVKC
jgi:hypothetical protein